MTVYICRKQVQIGCDRFIIIHYPSILGKDEVAGSNPAISSIEKP